MIQIEGRLLKESPLLRRKVEECRKMARDVKIRLVFEEMRLRGDGYNDSVRRLCRRFEASPSTVKRAIRRMAPPWERKRSAERRAREAEAKPAEGPAN